MNWKGGGGGREKNGLGVSGVFVSKFDLPMYFFAFGRMPLSWVGITRARRLIEGVVFVTYLPFHSTMLSHT